MRRAWFVFVGGRCKGFARAHLQGVMDTQLLSARRLHGEVQAGLRCKAVAFRTTLPLCPPPPVCSAGRCVPAVHAAHDAPAGGGRRLRQHHCVGSYHLHYGKVHCKRTATAGQVGHGASSTALASTGPAVAVAAGAAPCLHVCRVAGLSAGQLPACHARPAMPCESPLHATEAHARPLLQFHTLRPFCTHPAAPAACSSFPVVGFTSVLNVAEAFSLAGFGFYLQAMLMPMCAVLACWQALASTCKPCSCLVRRSWHASVLTAQ